jgi:hypothetical protein
MEIERNRQKPREKKLGKLKRKNARVNPNYT